MKYTGMVENNRTPHFVNESLLPEKCQHHSSSELKRRMVYIEELMFNLFDKIHTDYFS